MAVKLLVIEDSVLRTMMQDPRLLQSVPCLAQPKKALDGVKPGGTNCQRCLRTKQKITRTAMQQAKSCIRNLKGESLKEVKQLLNAEKLRVSIGSKGKVTQFTL